jgi:hypothetical protein
VAMFCKWIRGEGRGGPGDEGHQDTVSNVM